MLASAIDTEHGEVGAGLINETYGGLLLTTPGWSPLQYVVKWLNNPSTDIGGRSTTVKLHEYRFNQPVNGRHYAVSEFDIDISLVAGMGPLIRGFQWSAVVAQLTSRCNGQTSEQSVNNVLPNTRRSPSIEVSNRYPMASSTLGLVGLCH